VRHETCLKKRRDLDFPFLTQRDFRWSVNTDNRIAGIFAPHTSIRRESRCSHSVAKHYAMGCDETHAKRMRNAFLCECTARWKSWQSQPINSQVSPIDFNR